MIIIKFCIYSDYNYIIMLKYINNFTLHFKVILFTLFYYNYLHFSDKENGRMVLIIVATIGAVVLLLVTVLGVIICSVVLMCLHKKRKKGLCTLS